MILGKFHAHSEPNSLVCRVDMILLGRPPQISETGPLLICRLDVLYIQPTTSLLGLLVISERSAS